MTLIKGDCLEEMVFIKSASVDLILTDPPYGTTDATWDKVLNFDFIWKELWRIAKINTPVVMFGVEPFSSRLRLSDKHYRYDWYWNKRKAANFLFGNKQPMKIIETISVFYRKQPNHLPQKIINPKGVERRGSYASSANTNRSKSLMKNMPKTSGAYGKSREPDKLLPTCLVEFSKPSKPIHPTQKPTELLEYLIKTYSREGETVLDFTMGSGSTGVACKNLKRNFIGIEQDSNYFKIAKQRIKSA